MDNGEVRPARELKLDSGVKVGFALGLKSNNVGKGRGESSSSRLVLEEVEDRERKMGGVRKVAMEVKVGNQHWRS